MKTVAVICEYNPFHRGHAKQLSALRERFAAAGEEVTVLALMSGNYVQRGEPALFDKYIRTKSGAPLRRRSCSRAAVSLLRRARRQIRPGGSVSCGKARCGYARFRKRKPSPGRGGGAFAAACRSRFVPGIGKAGRPPSSGEGDRSLSRLREEERRFEKETGMPYPAASNDRLGAEYVRSVGNLRKTGGVTLSLLPLTREKDGFSAHRARALFLEGDEQGAKTLLPEQTAVLYEGVPAATWQKAYPILLARLRAASREELQGLFDIPAEIAARLLISARSTESASFADFFASLQNKNDTDARLRRSLLTSLLSVTERDIASPPAFSLLLGANKRGREYLRSKRRKADADAVFPLFSGLSQAFSEGNTAAEKTAARQCKRQAELQLRAELFYGFFEGRVRGSREILRAKPILL